MRRYQISMRMALVGLAAVSLACVALGMLMREEPPEIIGLLAPDDLAMIQDIIARDPRIRLKTIMVIEVKSKTEVEVTTGFSDGLLSGSGHDVLLRKANGIWKVEDISDWLSALRTDRITLAARSNGGRHGHRRIGERRSR